LCRRAGGSTGGEDVIDEQDPLAGDGGSAGNLEDTARVLPALAWRKSRLAFRWALAHKRESSKNARLVEPAVALPAAMKQHGNHEQFAGSFGKERFDGGGGHGAKLTGRGPNTIVLEGVDRVAHAPVVCAE
jgi:hypothetical protein